MLSLSTSAYGCRPWAHNALGSRTKNLLYLPKIIGYHGQIWSLPNSKILGGWCAQSPDRVRSPTKCTDGQIPPSNEWNETRSSSCREFWRGWYGSWYVMFPSNYMKTKKKRKKKKKERGHTTNWVVPSAEGVSFNRIRGWARSCSSRWMVCDIYNICAIQHVSTSMSKSKVQSYNFITLWFYRR